MITIQNPYDTAQVIALDNLLDLIADNLKKIEETDQTDTELLNWLVAQVTSNTEKKILTDAICSRFIGE